MGNTILVQLTDPKAIGILREMEELHLIKVMKESVPTEMKLSDKYRGVFSKEDAQSFTEHTQEIRKEWGNT